MNYEQKAYGQHGNPRKPDDNKKKKKKSRGKKARKGGAQ